MTDMAQNRESWHLSKSVPVTLIVTLLVQGAAIIWAASAGFQSIEENSRRIVATEVRVTKVEESVQNQAVMLARIDENLKAIRDLVERIASDR